MDLKTYKCCDCEHNGKGEIEHCGRCQDKTIYEKGGWAEKKGAE